MITLTASASCHACGLLAEGDPDTADKAARKHVKPGHATTVTATPVTT